MEIEGYHTDLDVGCLRFSEVVEVGLGLAGELVDLERTYHAPYVVFVRLLGRVGVDLVEPLPECLPLLIGIGYGEESLLELLGGWGGCELRATDHGVHIESRAADKEG